MGWRGEAHLSLQTTSLGPVSIPRNRHGEDETTREAVLWSFTVLPSRGWGKSRGGTNGPTHFGRKTYSSVGRSVLKATDTEKGYGGEGQGDAEFHKAQ